MKEPIAEVAWRTRSRELGGWPAMSRTGMNCLIRLHNAKSADLPYLYLGDVDSRTRRKLEELDLIVAPLAGDNLHFTITGRGERVMNAYLRPPRRFDDVCPDCQQRPRARSKSGKALGYCRECLSRIAKARRAGGIDYRRRLRPGRLCSDCHEKPCRRFPSGAYSTYCDSCYRKHGRAANRRRKANMLTRIEAGERIACCRPGCNAPVLRAGNTVYDLCRDHWYAYQAERRDRRNPQSQAARRRRYGKAARP